MSKTRFKIFAAVVPAALIALCIKGSFPQSRRQEVMPFSTTVSVYSGKPCHVIVSLDGTPIADRKVLFTHKIGPVARQAIISIDAKGMAISDTPSHELLRLPAKNVDILAWRVESPKVSSSGAWRIRAGTARTMSVSITG